MRPWDPGLQPERTALAWQRTGLATVGVALVVLRTAVSHGAWAAVVAAGAALLLGVLTVHRSSRGYRLVSRRLRDALPPIPLADPRTATASVAVLGAAAVLTALT